MFCLFFVVVFYVAQKGKSAFVCFLFCFCFCFLLWLLFFECVFSFIFEMSLFYRNLKSRKNISFSMRAILSRHFFFFFIFFFFSIAWYNKIPIRSFLPLDFIGNVDRV